MQAQVITGGELAFDAILNPPKSQAVVDYLNQHIQNVIQTTTGLADSFVNTVKVMYDKFNSSAALEAAKAILYTNAQHDHNNVIYPVNDISTVNMIMQQYIMDLPEVNKLYIDNMCNGFENSYVNFEPDNVGKERFGYMQVMNGVLQTDSGNDDIGYLQYFSYVDPTGQKDKDLDFFERMSVLDTWQHVKNLIAEDIDPTSIDGESL